jgi:aromatase
MHSALSIEIQAAPTRVFELARDVSRWAELLPHYRRSAITGHLGDRVLAQFVALRPFGRLGIPVTWRAACWSDGGDTDDLRMHFRHVRGATRGMRVTWHIRPLHGEAARSQVTIEHDFRRPVPLLGADTVPGLVDRFFTQPIATRTLRRFKELAEAAEATP